MKTTIRAVAAVVALTAASAAQAQEAVQWKVSDGGNGHWYALRARAGRTWTQAEAACRAEGAYLATMTSPAERNFMVPVMAGNSCAIGGFQWVSSPSDEPGIGWRWVTDEAMTWTNWASWEPSNTDTYGTSFENVMGCFADGVWVDLADHLIWTQHYLVEWSADCTGDGIVDYGQILDGSYPDSDLDGIPDRCEAPEGGALVADSHEDFSSVQGDRGWFYEFDRGTGTEVTPMGYFVACDYLDEETAWCTRSTFGTAGSYCHLGRESSATSTSFDCSSASAGLQRPRRRWTSVTPVSGSLVLTGRFYSLDGFRARLSVIVDGQTVFVIDSTANDTFLNPTIINAALPISNAHSVVVLEDPLDGSCHSDGARYRLRIFGNDCDFDGVADFVEINAGSSDADANGVPDICEVDPCPGDITNGGTVDATDLSIVLAAWGTTGQGEFQADIDGSGLVDGGDLALVLGGWGPCPQ